MKNIDSVIDSSNKLTELLKEYKESLIFEKCKYHLVSFDNSKQYGLYLIESKKDIVFGPKNRIESYLRLRNIDTTLIYNFSSLK
jgi:hypothetical protein